MTKTEKELQQKYDELFRMTESYIKRLHAAEEEKKRLWEALERISIGMDVRPFDASAAQVEGYFRGFAEATLKKDG
jgi:hypothetical protein